MGSVLGLGKVERGSMGLVYKLGKRKKRFLGLGLGLGKGQKSFTWFERSRNRFLELRKGETGFWGLVVG